MYSEVKVFFAAFVSESAIQLLANHNLIVLATLFHLLFFFFYTNLFAQVLEFRVFPSF